MTYTRICIRKYINFYMIYEAICRRRNKDVIIDYFFTSVRRETSSLRYHIHTTIWSSYEK